jgi:hypothetical protein
VNIGTDRTMKKKKKLPSLFSREARGGVIGSGGYKFQDSYIVAHLPDWLEMDGFEAVVSEGFDDVDVLFKKDQQVESWHYQIKDHRIIASEFKNVVKRFDDLIKRPGCYVTQLVLGCCGLDTKVDSLWRKIREFRQVKSIYSNSELEESQNDLVKAVGALGLSDYSSLLLDKIEIDCDHPELRSGSTTALAERFRGKFIKLPYYRSGDAEFLDDLVTKLALMVSSSIRKPLTRLAIEDLIIQELGRVRKGQAKVVYFHGWVKQGYAVPADEEIDWRSRFDHSSLKVPTQTEWDTELLPQLRHLRQRLADQRVRNIWLYSKAPLSAGLAFGNTFSAAEGYNIRIEQPSPGSPRPLQYWETDGAIRSKVVVETQERAGNPEASDILVGIGVTGDPAPAVDQFLGVSDLVVKAQLYLFPKAGSSETSMDEGTVNGFAKTVKERIREYCGRYTPIRIHLFYFGPLGLAVLLGQKLNGLGADVQCYERSKSLGYTPSCLLPA